MIVVGKCENPEEVIKVIRKMWQSLERFHSHVGCVLAVGEV